MDKDEFPYGTAFCDFSRALDEVVRAAQEIKVAGPNLTEAHREDLHNRRLTAVGLYNQILTKLQIAGISPYNEVKKAPVTRNPATCGHER